VFFIPIYHKFLSPLIVLWAVTNLVLIIGAKERIKIQKTQFALIGLYLLLAIVLIWTENLKAGGFDLEVKMSLVLFPLFFIFLNYSRDFIRFVVYAFISGIVIGSIFLMYHAIVNYQMSGAIDSFFYINFSIFIHPSYLSFYLVTGMMVLLVDLKYRVLNLFNSDVIVFILIFLFFVMNILLLSKIGIATGVVLVCLFTVQWIFSKNKYVLGGGIILVLVFSLLSSYYFSPYAKQRIDEAYLSLNSSEGNYGNSSTGIRLKIWKEGITLLKEKPIFGHGTGDVKDVLMTKYELNGVDVALEKKLNAHNQFIQIGIGLGGLGLTVFFLMYYFGILNGVKTKNYFSLGFLIISVFFMLPESILENQAGTIFFGLFISLFNHKSFSKL
jgi:O-antigen ligase